MLATALAAEPRPDGAERAAPAAASIGQLLLAQAMITEVGLARSLSYQAEHPAQRLGSVLVRLGALSKDNLLATLSEQTGYAVVTLATIPSEGIDSALRRLGWPAARLVELRCAAPYGWTKPARWTPQPRLRRRAPVRWQPAAAESRLQRRPSESICLIPSLTLEHVESGFHARSASGSSMNCLNP